MNNRKPCRSDSSDSSDTTAELEVVVPVTTREEDVSSGPSGKNAAGSSGQLFPPSSTSPPLDTATPGPSEVVPRYFSSSSRSFEQISPSNRHPEQITRLACTIKYLWHLLRQHERNDELNPGLVRFWATRYGTLAEHDNGCNFTLNPQQQRQTSNMSTSTSEDLRSLTVEPPSEDESTERTMDALVFASEEDPDYQTQDDLNSSSYNTETSLKEKSDTDDDKTQFVGPETSSSSSKDVADELSEPMAAMALNRIQDGEQSDDSSIFDFSEPKASTSQNIAQNKPNPKSAEQRRIEQQQRRRLRAQNSKRAVVSGVIRILVPTAKVGRIVGKGGRQIKEIEKKTGTNITIESRKSKKPATEITVRGPSDAIAAADQEIRDLIRNYKQ